MAMWNQGKAPKDDLKAKLEGYPNMFLLQSSNARPKRLKEIKHNIEEERRNDSECLQEVIQKLNFYTWIEYHLDEEQKAEELNDEVLGLTNWDDMAALGNRVYIMWRKGDEDHADKCLEKLRTMRQGKNGDWLFDQAQAQLAYCYERLGGVKDLLQAEDMYIILVGKYPQEYYWKYLLGLSCRRISHTNAFASSDQKLNSRSYMAKAASVLFDVTLNCKDRVVLGCAYSELAVLSRDARSVMRQEEVKILMKQKTMVNLCESALRFGDDNPQVLTTCGKLLRLADKTKAMELLEKSLKLMENSTTYHHLGLLYENLSRCGEKQKVSGPSNGTDAEYLNLNRCRNQEIPLDMNSKWFSKAQQCYEMAVQVSFGQNIPAIYNLGCLLKSVGKFSEALTYFNKITNSCNVREHGCIMTIINSHEQSGICFLKLHELNPKSDRVCYREKAETKLMQALELQAQLVAKIPDMKDYAMQVWNSFRTMRSHWEGEIDIESKKKLIKLLELFREYGKLLDVVNSILSYSENDLDDPVVLTQGLEGYLALRQYEKALSFLNLLRLRPAYIKGQSDPCLESLALKANLYTAAFRLQTQNGSADAIFHEVFQNFSQNACRVSSVCENDELTRGSDVRTMDEKAPDYSDDIIDILFVCDEDGDDGSVLNQAVQRLENTASHVFGLKTAINLSECAKGGVKLQLQLEEIGRSDVVVVVLSSGTISWEFRGLLEFIPSIRIKGRKGKSSVRVVTTDAAVTIPRPVTSYEMYCMEDVTKLNVVSTDAVVMVPLQTDTVSEPGQEFGDNVHATMALFSFLIGKYWPL